MKKVLVPALLSAFILGSLGVSAQVNTYKSNVISGGNSVAYALPRTVIKVTVITDKETIKVGPYARFAQKYLGVMAPLSNKENYTLVVARLGYAEEADPAHVYVMDNPDKSPLKLYNYTQEGLVAPAIDGFDQPASAFAALTATGMADINKTSLQGAVSHTMSDSSFVKVPVDKQSVSDKSPDDMANTAANTIFNLRKRRMELITGEAGENVFGAGLKAALDEINRLEHEYLALFLGKQYRERTVREFDAIPEGGSKNMVACRFNETSGAVAATDLTGRPLTLEFTSENKTSGMPEMGKAAKGGVVNQRIAEVVNCRLMDGKQELALARIPIYQFGKVVQIPVTSVK